jgi:hypothetical protein
LFLGKIFHLAFLRDFTQNMDSRFAHSNEVNKLGEAKGKIKFSAACSSPLFP